MADTTTWTLQECANAAGQRREQAPVTLDASAPSKHECQGCGVPLDGQRNALGLLRVFCSTGCMTRYNRRWTERPDDTALLRLTAYYWSEW